MDDRDLFAAAALTGFIRGMPSDSIFHLDLLVRQSYEVADAMLRERNDASAEKTSGSGSETLSDEEREAIGVAIQCVVAAKAQRHPEEEESRDLLHKTDATLSKLLERLS